MAEVAIFSTSIDEPTYGPVLAKLSSAGHEPWVYNSDRVMSGQDRLELLIDGQGFSLNYNNQQHFLSGVHSAWFRHPDILNISLDDKAMQLSIEREVSSLQDSIWQQVPEQAWLNSPNKMNAAQAKLAQLAMAQEVGFEIPHTVASNDWNVVSSFIEEHGQAIAKMSKGVLYEDNQTKVVYTTMIDQAIWNKLRDNNPFPAIYQQYVPKAKEWRVTVVGDDVFQAAIYTTEDAKDDWRKYQQTPKVTFSRELMPGTNADRCVAFVKRLGLIYGAFDFVEDYDGKITFLECNTNGQYKWLEDTLDLPISDAITSVLISKTQQQ